MQYLNPYIELCLEGSSSVFKGLNQKDKEILAQQHKLSIIKKGQFLFKEGDKPHGLICLASGKVKVFRRESEEEDRYSRWCVNRDLLDIKHFFLIHHGQSQL